MKRYLREQVSSAVAALGLSGDAPPTFEKPRTAEHGDLTTNIALALAKASGMSPRNLAQKIVERLGP